MNKTVFLPSFNQRIEHCSKLTADRKASEIESCVHWCNINHHKLNISKTQDMIFDAKCIFADHLPVFIHGEVIAQIGQYKYLGVNLDIKLSWNVHVHSVCSKIHQRLYFLRRLRAFGVDEKILVLFYRSIIESILLWGYCLVWKSVCSVEITAFSLDENCHANNRFHISHDLPSVLSFLA